MVFQDGMDIPSLLVSLLRKSPMRPRKNVGKSSAAERVPAHDSIRAKRCVRIASIHRLSPRPLYPWLLNGPRCGPKAAAKGPAKPRAGAVVAAGQIDRRLVVPIAVE